MCTSDNTKVENYNNNEEAATILQKNGQSSFTKNGDMELKSSINTVKKKTKFWAYFWWLFGGLFGAHHVYLDRDDHAIVWFCTLGGYFGFGWFRELWRIPTYVADANDDPAFIERFKHQVKNQKKVRKRYTFLLIDIRSKNSKKLNESSMLTFTYLYLCTSWKKIIGARRCGAQQVF